MVAGAWRITLQYSMWAEAGAPPRPDADPEVADVFGSQHSALARIVGAASQHVSIETVGHVGAPDVSFLFSVDGHRLGQVAEPTPLAVDSVTPSCAAAARGVAWPIVTSSTSAVR